MPLSRSYGGHINYETFLKDVAYFGPNDEYVVSGSDSGDVWVWDRVTTELAHLLHADKSILENSHVPTG